MKGNEKDNKNKDGSGQDEDEDKDLVFFDTEEGPADETIKDDLLKKTVAAKKAGMLYDPEDGNVYYNTVAKAIDEQGKNDLMRAAEKGDYASVKDLIKKGYALTSKDKDGNTALMLACEEKDSKSLNKLLVLAAPNLVMQLNMQDKDGKTLLIKAAEKKDVSFVRSVISAIRFAKHEAAFTAQDKDGNTALMRACANNNLEMVKVLSEGQKPEYLNMRNKEGRSAYFMTSDNQIREILKANGANITLAERVVEASQRETIKTQDEIYIAEIIEKSKVIRTRLNIKTVLDFRNKDGDTALILASRANNFKIVKEIIDGIPKPEDKIKYINISNNKGENALSIHDFSADVDNKIAQYLVEQGNSELLGFNYVKQQQHKKDAPKQEFTSRLSAVEKGYKTDLEKIKDSLQKKKFKSDLEAEQAELGQRIRQDRLLRIFGYKPAASREELREMQKMLGRVKRSDQVTGLVDRVINKFSNKKGRTQ